MSSLAPWSQAQETPRLAYSIALHGGAGVEPEQMKPEERAAMEASLRRALTIGRDVLDKGGASLDAVEQTLRILEDDPQFNAGKGSVFNSAGECELDASIMDGRNKACGAVAGVKTIKNPISLARLVMTRTRHVLLIGVGADEFGREMGVEQVDQDYFRTEFRRQDWLRVKKQQDEAEQKRKNAATTSPSGAFGSKASYRGTVGCVALDRAGNLAAGTSTGGLTNKRFGRVGDSPIVGAGCYADNNTCAVSCTGTGEEFIRNAAAHDVAALIAYKSLTVAEAADEVIHRRLRPDDGGMIVVGKNGDIAMPFSTAGMARAAADANGRFEVLLGKEETVDASLLKTFVDEFVAITPGEGVFPKQFTMGRDQGGAENESPASKVSLSGPFQIARYEVPQNLWEAVMGINPSKWKGPRNSVEMLSHDDAVTFCEKITAALRREKLIQPTEEVRLPTEAEWEYCARAGTATIFSFGDDVASLNDYGWHTGNAAGNDPPVGAKKPNDWGLHDVHGYLWEWCADDWNDSHRGRALEDGSQARRGPTAERKVLRGGSWKDRGELLTSSARRGADRQLVDDAVGLRCVLAPVRVEAGQETPPRRSPGK